MNDLKWELPLELPQVRNGTEKEFWVAVQITQVDTSEFKIVTYLAQYQNRPLILDDDDEPTTDDYLTNTDGEPMESIGWVTCKCHYEFEDFYEAIEFNADYKLIGWAEYTPPEFKGDK